MSASHPHAAPAPNHTVLVIDDNPITLKTVRMTLEAVGHRVLSAGSGQAALAVLATEAPDLVLQDLVLPDIDGFELLAQLRACAAGGDIPIICYSGLVGRDEQQRVLAAGFTDVLYKPATPGELLTTIQSYLPQRPAVAPAFAGRRVLVVDDDPVLRRLAAVCLKTAGAQVETAADGDDGLAQARLVMPDVILSDVLMPNRDGFGFCLALRQDPALKDIPVVLLSSQYVNAAERALAQKVGANTLVERSPDLQAALAALADALGHIVPRSEHDVRGLQSEHLTRVMCQIERQVAAHAQSLQTQAMYRILAGFIEHAVKLPTGAREPTAQVDEVLLRYLDACGVPTGAVYLLEADGELLVHAVAGVRKERASAWFDFFGEAELLQAVMSSDEPVVWPEGAAEPERVAAVLERAAVSTLMLCPLAANGSKLGVLVLGARRQKLDPDALALVRTAADQPDHRVRAHVRRAHRLRTAIPRTHTGAGRRRRDRRRRRKAAVRQSRGRAPVWPERGGVARRNCSAAVDVAQTAKRRLGRTVRQRRWRDPGKRHDGDHD